MRPRETGKHINSMETIRLSYIVPVYNTLSWLKDCLDSLLDHHGNDIEFVLVDDGSTDGSSELLQHYANKDSRIKLIRQANKGLSAARNIGLANAGGQYILFVDSDDVVDSKAVIRMVETAEKEDADIVTGQIMCFNENGIKSPWGIFLPYGVYETGFDYMKAVNSVAYVPMVFGYMFRRELSLKHALEFIPGLIHEDELWTPMLIARARIVVTTELCHYYYRTDRDGSIMNNRDEFNRCMSIAVIIKCLFRDIMTIATDYKKALPFYYCRFATLISIINGSSLSRDGTMTLINASVQEYFMEFCTCFKTT